MNKRDQARLKLVGIFLLFAGPIALSYFLYYGLHGWRAGAATNGGELLTPAQAIPTLQLAGASGATTSSDVFGEQWTFLQVAPTGCDADCRQSLDETRQIWLLLHDERDRVQRVLFVEGGRPQLKKFPRVKVYSGDLQPLWSLIESRDAGSAGTVYLVDPHGNWVLYYPPQQDGTELYKDTKHLLKLSHIG